MDNTTYTEKKSHNIVPADVSKVSPSIDTEKCDISPEYSEKSSSNTTLISHDQQANLDVMLPRNNPTDESNFLNEKRNENCTGTVPSKSTGLAFTINFDETKMVDKQKLKEMAERFQNRQLHQQEQRRHRRGASLSKLEDCRKSSISLDNAENSPSSIDDSSVRPNKPPFKYRNTPSKSTDAKSSLRISRPATSKVQQDSVKRHSWSPRSSLNNEKLMQFPFHQANDKTVKRVDNNVSNFQPKSTILQRTLDCNATTSTSRTRMCESFNAKIADLVVTAPLEYVRSSDEDGSIGDVSQATYTLDGDNYTEEEKERMSIDKFNRSDFNLSIESLSTRHLSGKELPDITTIHANCSNKTKQDNKQYRHQREQASTAKSAKFYLDKIKTHVKSIGDRTFQSNMKKELSNDESANSQTTKSKNSSGKELDHGTFTR